MNLEGGCSCGAIRYKLTNSPLIVHACHFVIPPDFQIDLPPEGTLSADFCRLGCQDSCQKSGMRRGMPA